MGGHFVFAIGASSYLLFQMAIKPRQRAESLPQFLDSLLVSGNVPNLLIIGRTSVSILVPSFGIEKQPLPDRTIAGRCRGGS